jgi:hypothetical protein
MAKPVDVDAYIASSISEARPILEEIRMIIKSAVPGLIANAKMNEDKKAKK